MANNSLSNAKKAKNDEFYTVYEYIQKEINAYLEFNPNTFRGKTVLLPCDDPEYSNFTRYFAQNFEMLGLKKLISTSYAYESKSIQGQYQLSFFESESPQYDPDKTKRHGKIFTLTRDSNQSGRIDIDDLEWRYLEGDGDFRSDEVRALRDEADIIVTNPPFSLFREFVAWIMEAGKRFLIIGNQNAITYKEIFPLIKDNQLWIGATNSGKDMVFEVPDGADVDPRDKTKAEKLGYVGNYTRLGNACWYTNIDHGRRHQPLQLMTMADNIKFSRHKQIREQGYLHYDNYDAIEVPFVDAIPSDYVADMGVPISYLEKHNPDQFEIVRFRKGDDGKDLTYTIPCSQIVNVERERERERESHAVLPHHHSTEIVTALWACRSRSSSDSTPNNSKSSEPPKAKARDSQADCGTPPAASHSPSSTASAVTSASSSARRCNGVMGVPITFLEKYCPDQFEILGATQRGCHDLVPDTKKYDDYWEVKPNGERTGSSGSKTNENANIAQNDGKKNYFINQEGHIVQSAYQRIFIRAKKV